MLAIFGFRKNRNQTVSNQGPEPEAEVYGDGGHAVAATPTGFVFALTQNEFGWTIKRRGVTKDSSFQLPHSVSPSLLGHSASVSPRKDADKCCSKSSLSLCWYMKWPVAANNVCACVCACVRADVADSRRLPLAAK